MNKPVTVTWPPILSRSIVTGQLYAISGDVWLPVPDGTTRKDLPRYMVVKRSEAPVSPLSDSWQVQGSKGNTYTVRSQGDQWTCTCAGFGWRRKCRHVAEKKEENESR